MIVDVNTLLKIPRFAGRTQIELEHKLDALEQTVRAVTHNSFQNRRKRFIASSSGGILLGANALIKTGDTVEISESINAGLYVVGEVSASTALNSPLIDAAHNLVTRIEYPSDVVDGVIELLAWDLEYRAKIGVKSETLSRHSVTYADIDGISGQYGYPASMLGFLRPYMKARF